MVEDDSSDESEDSLNEVGGDDDNDDDAETKEVKKPKKGFEKRIERFNRKLSKKDEEIEYWKKAALGGAKDEVQPEKSPTRGKPTYDEYNDIELFTEALTDWKVEQALNQRSQKQEADAVLSTYDSRLEEFKKTTPDFHEVMDEFIEDYGDKSVPEIVQTVMESDNGPALAYYLATHTDDVDRIAEMPSHRRFIELGKLADRLATTQNKGSGQIKQSKASPPAGSVKNPGKIDSRTIYDDLPFDQWVKVRNKKK